MEKENFWYDINRIKSYNALFNFIMCPRGNGKTYSFKKMGIKEGLYNNNLFMLLRRTDVELKDAMDSFFRDVGKEFPGYNMRVWKNEFQLIEIDVETGEPYDDAKWITVGYGAYLSNARRKKSVSYEGVKYILFDEFCIPKNQPRANYLEDEVTIFLDFYETVARMRDVYVFFISNAMSKVNPYFLFFNIKLPDTKSGIKRIGKDIAVEYSANQDYVKAKKATRFGQLVEGTEFARYAFDNEFVDENEDGIEKKAKDAHYFLSLSIDDCNYGVYYSKSTLLMYVSENYNSQVGRKVEYKSLKKYGKDTWMKQSLKKGYLMYLKEAFLAGNMRYESEKIKENVWNMFRRLI